MKKLLIAIALLIPIVCLAKFKPCAYSPKCKKVITNEETGRYYWEPTNDTMYVDYCDSETDSIYTKAMSIREFKKDPECRAMVADMERAKRNGTVHRVQ